MKKFSVTLYFEVDSLDLVDELEKQVEASSPEAAVTAATRGEWFDLGGGVFVPRERLTSVRVEDPDKKIEGIIEGVPLEETDDTGEGSTPCANA